MWKYLPLTFKNLLRNRRRSILTILSLTVSLFLVGVLLSIYAAFLQQEVSEEQALRLVTRHRVSLTQALPEYYGSRIRQIDGVKEICPRSWFGGTYKDRKRENQFARFAVEPETIFKGKSGESRGQESRKVGKVGDRLRLFVLKAGSGGLLGTPRAFRVQFASEGSLQSLDERVAAQRTTARRRLPQFGHLRRFFVSARSQHLPPVPARTHWESRESRGQATTFCAKGKSGKVVESRGKSGTGYDFLC